MHAIMYSQFSYLEACLPQLRTVFVLEMELVKRLGGHWILLHLVVMEEEEENDNDLGPSFQNMCNNLSDVANSESCTTPEMRARV